jgi:asparagine synthase (glutamine-hydrolysing)
MCGIAGIVSRGKLQLAPDLVSRMANAMSHRGPDESGYWHNADTAFGFRRLSIVDLGCGHQPMANEDRTIHCIFNGEIYNHRELRKELEKLGHRFQTDHSDTEVLVHGYEEWGCNLPRRLNGMFGFAIWDSRKRRLVLARDRFGIKPLYVASAPQGVLLFASELKAIFASGLIRAEPDDNSVLAYFQNQNVWHQRCMFKNVTQVLPGHTLIDEPSGRREKRYWDITFNRRKMSRTQAADALRTSVEQALDRQLAADVPVTTYLSGGVDSSAIAAGAYQRDPHLRAYSCIFDLNQVGDDKMVDEREFSRLVANHLGIQHVELELPQTSLIGSLHSTIRALEEPRMGMAYVNYLIARRVAVDSKVVLSGCGGDEILGGYVARYGYVQSDIGQNAGSWLHRARALFSMRTQDSKMKSLDRIVPLYRYPLQRADIEMAFTAEFRGEAGEFELETELGALLKQAPSDHIWDQLLYADAKTYLAGLLMVEDKLSMANSLEARVPLLDNEVVDLALSTSWDLLTDGRTGKIAFRDAIGSWLPSEIVHKPKMGFGPPDASWYRGPLQPFIRRILSPSRIAARGVFRPEFVLEKIEQHMSGQANNLSLIWSLISFDAWCEVFGLYGGDLGEPMEQNDLVTNHCNASKDLSLVS